MADMKWGLVVGGVIILVAVGYYFLVPSPLPTNTETPTDTGGAAKINIDAVCEGALAYMTFPSGAEADAFVVECKEGKHPEVIEQWKVQMGISTDRAI